MNGTPLRLLVVGITLCAVLSILGIIFLTEAGKEPPHALTTIAAACIGFLTGLPVKMESTSNR